MIFKTLLKKNEIRLKNIVYENFINKVYMNFIKKKLQKNSIKLKQKHH